MTTVSLADLTHTGILVDANNIPLAIGYIAAYAKTKLNNDLDMPLFKYPSDLSQFLGKETPRMACFTHYMWNARISSTFARQIKKHHPETVIVMGGPHYPVDATEQRRFLESHPEIDFYVDGEGEMPFVELVKALDAVGFDAERLKSSGQPLPSVDYIYKDRFVQNELMSRVIDLDKSLPSPYLTGLLDKFFDDKLTAMIQTSRGCPYSCTFCHDGIDYMNKIRAFSMERVQAELTYIESRIKTPTLLLSDLNWGIFPNDLRVAEMIADSRKRTGWPRNVACNTAKNQKDRVIEMSRVLGDLLQLGAAVQSTDPEVLRNIKRTNISLDAIIKMAKASTASRTGSFSEIILALPGDTKEKHIKSVCDLLDAGIQDIRSFQLILLPGTEANDVASRNKFQYQTGFRVLPRGFGKYQIYGEEVPAAEIQEICISNNTMNREDYTECRAFDLTVSIFNNGGVVKEFFRLAETLGVSRSTVLRRIHQKVRAAGGGLAELYAEFRTAENRNFHKTFADLEAFLALPGTMDAYLRQEYGVNHIYRSRAIALLSMYEQIVGIAQQAVTDELRDQSLLDSVLEMYLDELRTVLLARKSDLLDLDRVYSVKAHFDFVQLHAGDYLLDVRQQFIPGGIDLTISRNPGQRADLEKYFVQFGKSLDGMAYLIQRNDVHLSAMLYRGIAYTHARMTEPTTAAAA